MEINKYNILIPRKSVFPRIKAPVSRVGIPGCKSVGDVGANGDFTVGAVWCPAGVVVQPAVIPVVRAIPSPYWHEKMPSRLWIACFASRSKDQWHPTLWLPGPTAGKSGLGPLGKNPHTHASR